MFALFLSLPLLFLPDAVPVPEPLCPGLLYPAVMSLYDPDLGGWNCDDDCSTVATGLLQDWMYEVAGACPFEFTGWIIQFPDLDRSLQCVDRGTAVRARWSDHHDQCVVYFDVLWHLPDENGDGRIDRDENGLIPGLPYWAYWKVEDWSASWMGTPYHVVTGSRLSSSAAGEPGQNPDTLLVPMQSLLENNAEPSFGLPIRDRQPASSPEAGDPLGSFSSTGPF